MSHATSAMMQLLSGYWYTQTLYTITRLDIPDHLADGPLTVDALAHACNAHPEALYRLLRALTTLGIFDEPEPRTFALTPLSTCLRSDVEHSLRPIALLSGAPWHWNAWGKTLDAVRSAQPPLDLFAHFDAHPEDATLFAQVMGGPHAWNQAIVEAFDFAPFHHLVDLGGADGALAHAISRTHPKLRTTVFDRPPVVERHPHHTADPRALCHHLAGDFFDEVPTADAYVLRFILHDWDDEHALRILQNVRSAMAPKGRVLVIEKLLEQGRAAHADAALFDVTMLVLTGGRERSADDFAALFAQAELELVSLTPTRAGLFILEARATPS